MKNMTKRDEDIKAWKTFIQSLTVEHLLSVYVESHSTHDYISGTTDIGGGNRIAFGFETFWEYMAILHGDVWYVFSTPPEMWERTVPDVVDNELLHVLDFGVVEDLIRVLEL